MKYITKSFRKTFSKSFFASHHSPPSFVMRMPQNSLKNSQINLVRRVAIMHDKLNDAVGIVNCSFTYEVKYPACIVTDPIIRPFSALAAARDGFYVNHDNINMLQHFSKHLQPGDERNCHNSREFYFYALLCSFSYSQHFHGWHDNESCEFFWWNHFVNFQFIAENNFMIS